jgi:Ala-tRNA(Pro) deacylase
MEANMGIAPTLQKYLDAHVTYDIVQHEPTMSSTRTAQACHISGNRLVKAVVLRHDGGYMLAVLPASRHIHLADLCAELGEDVDFAAESEIAEVFQDCARGAVPPVGDCYGVDWIVDDGIDDKGDVYLEAGDHATLIRMTYPQFAKLTADARHGRFSM